MVMSFSTPIAILLAGLIAGTLDIGAAALINGINPLAILLVIASGVLGKASFQGGLPAVLLGLVLQWVMSLIIAALYVLASNRIPELKPYWIAGGLAYGVGVFLVMNYAVVPLSEIGRIPPFTAWTFTGNLVAMLGFGLLVAFFARGSA
ncbi:hypothetical protein [Bradyrhizobium sp. NP1]|jgi:hypothetical protein|uniref:hypothetical protein n=1 Tax=Bradyrhizobium sp. NP1 TaxID=3049772 RepID=UPI0025A5223E|nr:hypothetical protein [Bradyrhizobium sp. NP1]WJR81070.1 hypothetical protein QOU61_15345 [Bradyrhizobium sp. NP1]